MDDHQNKNQKNNPWYQIAIWSSVIIFFITGIISLALAATSSGIITAGDAAVTAFSGTVNQNKEVMIDINGPSVRVIQLPTSGPFGLRDAVKTFTAYARDVGQVFGVALNDKSQPDIFVAATSAYGLGIFQPDGGRMKKGAQGAQFIPGQFGTADKNGGLNSIWRIDGSTGKVTLFANVSYNGLPATPAALGGLAFDSVSQQLYVADRGTGMIHRFSPDGTDHGIYDHGQEGLKAAGLSPVAFEPKTLADINNASFDTTDPKTWGYAPEERRVFALAVHQNRLYYSVAGSHVWSVGITADGGFATDPRLEVDVSPLTPGTEISSIAFDDQGYMYIAERGFPTGDYNFMNVADAGHNRVIRFTSKSPTDSSPTYWQSPGDDYAIGMPPEYQNADGGVDINCKQTLWSTGERLLDPGDNSAKSFAHIDGLQGNDTKLVKPANTPPEKSWFINYYDNEAEADSRGHMGAIAILRICEKPATPPTVVVPPAVTCTSGTYWVDNCCVPPPTCPPDTYFQDGYCVYVDCPWGYVRIHGQKECFPPPLYCPLGTVFIDDYCVPFVCPPPLFLDSYGYCRCPYNTYYDNGRCLPVPPCPRGEIYIFGQCVPRWCPDDEIYINKRCVKRNCAFGEDYVNGRCVKHECTANEELIRGVCTKKSTTTPKKLTKPTKPSQTCPAGQFWSNGKCTSKAVNIVCPRDQVYKNGHCEPKTKTPIKIITPIPIKPVCPRGQVYKNGRCVTIPPIHVVCPRGQVYRHGRCVRVYVPPTHIQPNTLPIKPYIPHLQPQTPNTRTPSTQQHTPSNTHINVYYPPHQ